MNIMVDFDNFDFNNIQLSFHLAKQKHLAWKFKFVDYLNGNTSMRHSQAVSHTHCECGKWLYAEIIEQFNGMPEIHELEMEHRKIHEIADTILAARDKGDTHKTQEEYKHLLSVSNAYVSMLESVSDKLSNSDAN